MANITLSVPEELYKKMRKHTELKWSDIARQAFEKKLREIELAEKLLSKSELTEGDAERIGHAIKAEMRKRLEREVYEYDLTLHLYATFTSFIE